MIALVRQICQEQWGVWRAQTPDQDLITTRRRISALQRNLGIPSSVPLYTENNGAHFSDPCRSIFRPRTMRRVPMEASMRRFC